MFASPKDSCAVDCARVVLWIVLGLCPPKRPATAPAPVRAAAPTAAPSTPAAAAPPADAAAAAAAIAAAAGEWSAEQQKALEMSLKTFPATLGPERWDKIAEVVPGKLRAECIARYKQVVAALKAKKAAAAEAK